MYQSILRSLNPKMQDVVNNLSESLKGLRTGKANSALVENIAVTYYGSKVPLKQMANISTPDPNLIVIQPWDTNSLGDITLAIENSEIGLNPTSDGRAIRLSLPPMTAERREELIRMLHKMTEEAKIILRNLREESWKEVKKLETKKQITEDDRYRAEKDLNKLIEDFSLKINKLLEDKEKEIRTI
ncbi:MAG: Ribosome-recycling factor [Berkelbacteria bacterium GW2011_GWA1_36_9]|uniref:Ribosome-recycling factor n=1 Tax=Berkelbacteria bacterium GW2011_GWA1_36_9 TaxID=1618331 RepID=A0A0G0IPM7_9BACT|nr:MAG: Ribosome-recycling factor [Berkelbacteria bacterium GW2011_GWA1_36_9]